VGCAVQSPDIADDRALITVRMIKIEGPKKAVATDGKIQEERSLRSV
jgi:hypothetical protein